MFYPHWISSGDFLYLFPEIHINYDRNFMEEGRRKIKYCQNIISKEKTVMNKLKQNRI